MIRYLNVSVDPNALPTDGAIEHPCGALCVRGMLCEQERRSYPSHTQRQHRAELLISEQYGRGQ